MAAAPRRPGAGRTVLPDADSDGLRPPLTWRLRSGHWLAMDCLAAAGAAILLIGTAERQPLFFGIPHWAAITTPAGIALPVAVRRRWPRAALAAILAGTVAAGVAGFSTDPPAAAALVLYIVACASRRRARCGCFTAP